MSQDHQLPPTDLPRSSRGLIALLGTAALLFGIWLWLTPPGFWGKLNAVGYSVCHQITERSFVHNNLQSPLCARCAGMYLGALFTIIAHWIWGRHGKLPPLWVNLVLGLGLAAFAIDGLNSSADLFPFVPTFYETTNLTRLITGLGVGLGIGAILVPVFHQTAFADWIPESAFAKWYRFPLLIVMLSLLGIAIYSQHAVFFYIFSVLMGVSILLILWLIHTTLAVFLLRRTNQAKRWRELLLPGLLGFVMMMLQIGAISLARYLLTGTWLPFHL